MSTVNGLSKEVQATIIKLAGDVNFWGKRLRPVKLEICDSILVDLEISQTVIESGALCDWLLENKPMPKAKAAKAAKVEEELVPTFSGSLTGRDTDTMEDGTYLITAAQNNTLPHASFESLKTYARLNGVELLVMPIKYTTVLQGRERKEPRFDKAFDGFMLKDTDTWLGGEGCVLVANSAQILPTAKQPINAAERLNTGESITMVASPRRQMKTLSRQKNGSHRWVYSTGISTLKHYTDSRAGAEAESEHCYGGVLVTVLDGLITHRRLVADEAGIIIDSGMVYAGTDCFTYSEEFEQRPVIVLGDLHCEKMCDDSFKRALNFIVANDPQLVVLHDSLDFMSLNHHNRDDWTHLFAMQDRTVLDDLADVINYLNKLANEAPLFIVESNHDLAIHSWLVDNRYDVRKDAKNARTYHALMLAYIDSINDGCYGDFAKMDLCLKALADELPELSDNITFGKIDEENLCFGYDVGMHGHVGTGGARGSAVSFKKMRIKTVTGHTHSPFEDHNTVVVGVTGSMEMGYNKGGTTWDRANAIVYPNGTHQLIPTYAIGEVQY